MVEVALDAGARAAHLVDFADEIDEAWLEGVTTVGLTSGASVPEVLVDGVLEWLAERGYEDVETVKAAEESITFSLPKELRRDLRAEAAGGHRGLPPAAGIRGRAAAGTRRLHGDLRCGHRRFRDQGRPVDLDRGDLAQERHKVLTPHPATPGAVADGVARGRGPLRLVGPGRHHLPRSGHRRHRPAPRPTSTRAGSTRTPGRCSPTASASPSRS